MCVKFPPENLNSDLYLSHPTKSYTYGITIAPRVCGSYDYFILTWENFTVSVDNFFFFTGSAKNLLVHVCIQKYLVLV